MYKHKNFLVEQLDDGTEVLIRPLTPYVQNALSKRVQDKLPPKPTMPVREVKNAGGGIETIPVEKDEPEYIAWIENLKNWIEEKSKIEDDLRYDNLVATLDYSIVAWRRGNAIIRFVRRLFPLSIFWKKLSLWWHYDIPSDWVPHPLEIEGKSNDWTMREFYIVSQLLNDPSDNNLSTVASAAWGYREPVTEEEIAHQRAGFQDGGWDGQDTVGGGN
jgi:hypothetical protein